MSTTTILLLVAVGAAIVLLVWDQWRRRRENARRWLDAVANQLGFKRKPTETDEELRARCAQTMQGHGGRFTRAHLVVLVKDALWAKGYPRTEVDVTEVGPGHVRAHAKASVPADVLRVIERELGDHVPLTLHVELSAE